MRLCIAIFIGLLLVGCNAPTAEVENWHVYAVPTSECHTYSETPCEPETLGPSFKTAEEAKSYAREQEYRRENVLWINPNKVPEKKQKPDPIIKKNIIYKDVIVKGNPKEITDLKRTLAT